MREYTSIQITRSMKKKMFELKCDLKLRSFEDVITILLKIKNISFMLEREGKKREVSGIPLYDKLKDGWKITSYKVKGEDGQSDQI